MSKFALIEVAEREIGELEFFDTSEEAFDKMLDRFANVLDYDIQKIKEILRNEEAFFFEDGEAGINKETATAYINHDVCFADQDFDWKIFEIPFGRDSKFQQLKENVLLKNESALYDFLGVSCETLPCSVMHQAELSKLIDDAYMQMPEDIIQKFYAQYNL